MPNALPSADIALTRKSGCEYRMAMLIVGSTVCTNPTMPSGANTGLYDVTPDLLPAVSVSDVITSSARPDVCSASAGMNPQASRLPRPSNLRRRSFSNWSDCFCASSSAIVSRSSVLRSLSSQAARQPSALCCKPTSGATSDLRREAATGSRIWVGSALAANARTMHPAKTTVSRRPLNRAARAIGAQLLRTDQYFSSSSRILPVPRTTHVNGSSST